jgi:hypothetical protein
MGEQSGLGSPCWLPPSVVRAQQLEDIEQAREARQEQQRREARREELHWANLTLAQRQAEARGQFVSVADAARGIGLGRSHADVLAEAEAAADRDDAIHEARARRFGIEPVPHVNIGETVIHQVASTPAARTIASRSRHFLERVAARRKADELDGQGPVYSR